MNSNINRLIERRLNTPLQTINRKEYIEDLMTIKSELESLGGGNQESEWTYTEVDITSSQILNMGSTPIELLPAPGVGKYYDLKLFFEYTYDTELYSFDDGFFISSIVFDLYYGMLRFDTINQQVQSFFRKSDLLYIDLLENSAVNLYGSNDVNVSNGANGTIKVKIWYKIITFG